ncbi:putative aminoadipate reductase [Lentinula aciculospora]|uniref:Aminoadipate reductase n=1 Tax=Lentinula aciculospora TaxID=153920 RepID=A0A9W9DGD0_9AGAR|nr:putative aminoadipate reductase [Lentinula aciculospora]
MQAPSRDNFTTLPQLLRFHYEINPDQPLYVYSEDGKANLTEIKHLEFVRACHRAAHIIRPHRSGPGREVVAIIALVDTIVYTAVVAGLMEAGLIPLLISPRNTPAAVVNLLQKTGAHRVLSTQVTLQELLQNIETELKSPDGPTYDVTFEEIPGLNELFPKLGVETSADPFHAYPSAPSDPGPDDTALILHSSGSTGFPKPISITYISTGKQFRKHNMRVGTMSLPSFHALGFFIHLLIPIHAGLTVAVYPPIVTKKRALPLSPTPDNIIDHLQRTNCTACLAIPAMVQVWSQSPSSVDILRSMKVVLTGGGPLSHATGDYLISCGVHLRAIYGLTEAGSPTTWSLDDGFEDWSWHTFPDSPHVRWVPQGDGTFELQFLNTDTYRVSVENIVGTSGYATSDLWVPHPSKPGLWSIVGRLDDVLIHSSGEKTVPAPFEDVVNKSPLIIGAIMFGRQRDQPGVLLEPSPENQIDVNDPAEVSSFRNKIWPVVEEANKRVPAFSKVYKEMILVASPTKPLPRAGKGTIMRKAAYDQYENEIDQMYVVFSCDNSTLTSNSSVEPPSSWEISPLTQWLTAQVANLCEKFLDEKDDIFDHGFDSLCATVLRLRIISILRNSGNSSLQAASKLVSDNVVYNHPTIASLTQYLFATQDTGVQNAVPGRSHEDAIQEMITVYSQGLGTPITSKLNGGLNSNHGLMQIIVLLTGSTGNLGAQILKDLLLNDSVALVYTLNRPSTSASIQQRHQERFDDKALDVKLLSSQKLVHLEGDTSQPKLGLSNDIYEKLRYSLTHIIHNAWRLDFNLSLFSFESHVRGMRNLIDLARASAYASSLRFLFTSSIGSAQSWDSKSMGPYPEEVVLDPKYAVGGGYGESKYISERILAKSGLHVSSFRIGQIAGGTPNGAWAMSDWLPMIIKSSLSLNMLPNTKGDISWAPLDAIAEGILDVAFTKDDPPVAINLVHPQPVSWTTVMEAIRAFLISVKGLPSDALPLVPFRNWVQALGDKVAQVGADNDSASKNVALRDLPAAKIIEFVRASAKSSDLEGTGEGTEALGVSIFGTANIRKISKRMRELEPIGPREAELWVKYWVQRGL